MNRSTGAPAPKSMEHYGHDHTRLDNLRQQSERLNGTDLAAARLIFAEFKTGLARHMGCEEEVAEFLLDYPAVEGVHHPGPPSHPDHALATRQIAESRAGRRRRHVLPQVSDRGRGEASEARGEARRQTLRQRRRLLLCHQEGERPNQADDPTCEAAALNLGRTRGDHDAAAARPAGALPQSTRALGSSARIPRLP